jgi:hypothetical protein
MTRNNKFKPGVSGNPAAKWKPGQSGNPAGKSKRRTLFDEAFNEALITEGSPQEAAKLLWESARAKEPWAIQEVCRRFSPVTESLHMTHEVESDKFDLSRLTAEEIQQFEAYMERASAQPPPIESREGPAQPI